MKKSITAIPLALLLSSPLTQAVTCGDTTRIYNLYDMMSEIENDNGPGTIGPRRLVTNQVSEVVAFFNKQFVSPTPMDIDKIDIRFKKLGGSRFGGGVDAAICATDEQGNAQKLATVSYPGGKKNINQVQTRQLTGIKGKRLSVHVAGIGVVGWSDISFDLVRNINEGQPWIPNKSAPTTPATGFADLHVHQTAELAFSKGWYWGSHMPGHPISTLPACTGANHATLEPLGIEIHELGKAHTGLTHGYPDFNHWPSWDDIKHQQVAVEWLKQAHDGGLNIMMASVVNNQSLAAASIASGLHDNTIAPFDMESARLQITSLKQLDEQVEWFEIVKDPWHARRAIAQGKLAVILAVEVSHLFPNDDGPWKEQLWDLYDMGVRSIQIAHQHNNDFSGAAYHRDLLKIISQIKAWYTGEVDYASASDGIHNDIGLTSKGYQLLHEMIRLDMLIDIAHLPLKAQRQVYNIVANQYNYYPLYNSHTRINELLLDSDKDILKEHVTIDETLEFVRATGGLLALRTGKQGMKTYANSGVENNCDGSSRSFAQFYRYAADKGVGTTFGSDFNGFIEQMPPRFGADACATAPDSLRNHQISAQGAVDPSSPANMKTYYQKGLAHIGMLPALLQDLADVGADTHDLEHSAEAVLQMWYRVYDDQRKKL